MVEVEWQIAVINRSPTQTLQTTKRHKHRLWTQRLNVALWRVMGTKLVMLTGLSELSVTMGDPENGQPVGDGGAEGIREITPDSDEIIRLPWPNG